MNKILIIGTLPDYMWNFRGNLIKKIAGNKKNTITIMVTHTNQAIIDYFKNENIGILTYSVKRNGFNPIQDIRTSYEILKNLKKTQPNIIFSYTIKPIIWGGLVANFSLSNYKFYALITGLGFAFQGRSIKRRVLTKFVTILYRAALSNAERVIFQNPDNLNEFVQRGIIPTEKCALVNGSGVDIAHYPLTPLPNGNPTFLTIGRLLGEKGFREYAKAAQIVKARYPHTTFQLLGSEDPSPDGIPPAEVQAWHDQGILHYLGATKDVRPYLQASQVYVLPSYHEGMPRTVLEAMAIGRPILTTDVPGCRETVIVGENGYLVPKANADALAQRMIWFIEHPEQWEQMGKRSRELAEERYDVHKINAQLMEIMGIEQSS